MVPEFITNPAFIAAIIGQCLGAIFAIGVGICLNNRWHEQRKEEEIAKWELRLHTAAAQLAAERETLFTSSKINQREIDLIVDHLMTYAEQLRQRSVEPPDEIDTRLIGSIDNVVAHCARLQHENADLFNKKGGKIKLSKKRKLYDGVRKIRTQALFILYLIEQQSDRGFNRSLDSDEYNITPSDVEDAFNKYNKMINEASSDDVLDPEDWLIGPPFVDFINTEFET